LNGPGYDWLGISSGGKHHMITPNSSSKDIVRDILQHLPDEASLHEIAERIEFIAAIREGIADLDQGHKIPLEQIEKELPVWSTG
jgi:predicted transcriptional regulator